jgi:glycosyltransferase involved in cell wall biosynthesis
MKKIIIESQYLYRYQQPETGVTVGGSQRYALELGKLFRDMNWEVIFLTKAIREFAETYEDIGKIVALSAPFGSKGANRFSKQVYDFCKKENADIVCYSDILVGLKYCYPNSFALQHGIAWDIPTRKFLNLFMSSLYRKSAMKYEKVICVDTNFINWMRERSTEYFSNPDRLVYIPNFADENKFKYRYHEWDSSAEKFMLLYPRRFVKHRGYDIFMDMCKNLKEQGYNILPVIACEDFREEEFRSKYPDYASLNARIVHPTMDEIQDLYHESFLTIIPTRWSEGTSLSAIEAVSCGCPVVGSDVGGIANVIVPNLNGDIVPPSADSFTKAAKRFLDNVELRNGLARNCAEMNTVFGIKRWRNKVLDTINEML